MMALVNESTGELVQIVHDLAGIDLTGLNVIDPVPEPVHEYVWDAIAQEFTARPPSQNELARAAIDTDASWGAIDAAACDDTLDAWLESNVTTISGARAVLRSLIVAVRALRADKG